MTRYYIYIYIIITNYTVESYRTQISLPLNILEVEISFMPSNYALLCVLLSLVKK